MFLLLPIILCFIKFGRTSSHFPSNRSNEPDGLFESQLERLRVQDAHPDADGEWHSARISHAAEISHETRVEEQVNQVINAAHNRAMDMWSRQRDQDYNSIQFPRSNVNFGVEDHGRRGRFNEEYDHSRRARLARRFTLGEITGHQDAQALNEGEGEVFHDAHEALPWIPAGNADAAHARRIERAGQRFIRNNRVRPEPE